MAETAATTTPSKVRFGLKKLFFAKRNADGTYETPWQNPGAEELAISNGSSSSSVINADDEDFYTRSSAGSRQLDLTVARFARDYYTKFLGQQIDVTTGGLVDSPDDIASTFAVLYETTGDQGGYRGCFFGCTSETPTMTASTNTTNGITEDAEKASLKATPVEMNDGKKHTVISLEPGDKGYDDFFKSVPLAKASA